MPHSDPTLGNRTVAADNASATLHPAIRVLDAQPAAHDQRAGTGASTAAATAAGRHAQAGGGRHIHFASPTEDAPVESFETVPLPVDPDFPVLLTVPGLERYQLVKKMGEGAFSQVYHAIDLMSREHVAIKVIEKSHLNSIQRASVQKEASIHARLHHPNVIALRLHFETERNYVFVLELATGGELFHRIVELKYFSEDLARHVIVQVAKGIHYLHHQVGVVHRDIKPENLLFTPIPFLTPRKTVPTGRAQGEEKLDEGSFVPGVGGGGIGQVKIADFGLSKVVWTDGTKTPCGTAGYTAPETIQGQSYTQSVDLWALGCVLYTCLCGFPPFHDEDQIVLTQKVARGEWTFLQPWWNNISPSAKHLVSRLLEVRPERRYTIDQFFAHPWVQGTQASPEEPPSLAERTHVASRPGAIPATIIEDVDEEEDDSSLMYGSPSTAPADATNDPPNSSAFDWNSFNLPNLVTPATERPANTGSLFGLSTSAASAITASGSGGYNTSSSLPTSRPPGAGDTAAIGIPNSTQLPGGQSNPWNALSKAQPSAKTPSQRHFKQFFDASYRTINDIADAAAGITPEQAAAADHAVIASSANTSSGGSGSSRGWGLGVLPRFMAPLSSARLRGAVGRWTKPSSSGSSNSSSSTGSSASLTGSSGNAGGRQPASSASSAITAASGRPSRGPEPGEIDYASALSMSPPGDTAAVGQSSASSKSSSRGKASESDDSGSGFSLDLRDSSLLSRRRKVGPSGSPEVAIGRTRRG